MYWGTAARLEIFSQACVYFFDIHMYICTYIFFTL